MQATQTWLGKQAFGKDAGALVNIAYASHKDGLLFLQSVLKDPRGVALLQGPVGSGKTTTVTRFADRLPNDVAVAVIDGSRLKPRELLTRMLAQFGYHTGLESDDELLQMMGVFATQQAISCQPPVLIVDNVDRMYPSALRTLNSLAEVKAQERFALRIIVTGGEAVRSLIESSGMTSLASRNVGRFEFSPLSLREALIYLHARLGACGVNNADTVFPVDVCDALYQQSAGWPGLMNQFACEAIERATDFPLRLSDTVPHEHVEGEMVENVAVQELPVLSSAEAVAPLPPRLIITKDGKTISEYVFKEKKVLIGRSDFADIVIDDDFVSKMHIVLMLYSDALVMLDLNSSNGLTVNSARVGSTILKDNDVISLGNHRLKVRNAPAISDEMQQLLNSPNTIKMKNLVDMRRLRARRRTTIAAGGKQ